MEIWSSWFWHLRAVANEVSGGEGAGLKHRVNGIVRSGATIIKRSPFGFMLVRGASTER